MHKILASLLLMGTITGCFDNKATKTLPPSGTFTTPSTMSELSKNKFSITNVSNPNSTISWALSTTDNKNATLTVNGNEATVDVKDLIYNTHIKVTVTLTDEKGQSKSYSHEAFIINTKASHTTHTPILLGASISISTIDDELIIDGITTDDKGRWVTSNELFTNETLYKITVSGGTTENNIYNDGELTSIVSGDELLRNQVAVSAYSDATHRSFKHIIKEMTNSQIIELLNKNELNMHHYEAVQVNSKSKIRSIPANSDFSNLNLVDAIKDLSTDTEDETSFWR